jgi:hypothetical protein
VVVALSQPRSRGCVKLVSTVGLCTLNQVDPYTITYSLSNPEPIAYQMKNRFQNLPFKFQLAELHHGPAAAAGDPPQPAGGEDRQRHHGQGRV